MRKVLAAVDNSAAARPVLAVGAEVARLFRGRVEAVHVREDGGRTVAAVAETAGVTLREIEAETVIDGLLEAGRSRSVAVVVLGARAAQAGRRPAGHVALELIVALHKPLVVVPPSAPVPCVLERILVPLDATRTTTDALAETVRVACRSDVGVVVLHVHDEHSVPPFADQPEHELEAWSREFLSRYCPDAERARLEVRVGTPREHVLEVAAQAGANMIALGWAQDLSRGRAAVVREVLARSPIPVLLLPAAECVPGQQSRASASRSPNGSAQVLPSARSAGNPHPGRGRNGCAPPRERGDSPDRHERRAAMIGEITVIPQVEGPGRELIKKAVDEIDTCGLRYQVGATGTSVEGELDRILGAARAIERRLSEEGIARATIEIKLQIEPHEETLEHQIEGIAAES